MCQEVFWDGSTATSVETGETAPTTWYDSRVLNMDRINAWVGRYALLVADNVVAGTMSADRVRAGVLESVDGDTYFDLDNSEIVLHHSATDETKISKTSAMSRTTDGQYWDVTFNQIKNADVSSAGATDTDVSGTTTLIYGDLLDNLTSDPLYFHIEAVYIEFIGDGSGSGYRSNQFAVEKKANATDYGNGYANFYITQAAGSSTSYLKVDWSVRVRGTDNTPAGYTGISGRLISFRLLNFDPFRA
jgi:hypothetical protein